MSARMDAPRASQSAISLDRLVRLESVRIKRLIDEVAPTLQLQAQAEAKDRIAASLEVPYLYLLDTEEQPRHDDEDGDYNKRPGLPTHRLLPTPALSSPAQAPPRAC